MIVDTTPSNNLYEVALNRQEQNMARVRLENCVMAYISIMAKELSAEDTLNATLQCTDAVEEVLAGYRTVKKGITGE